MNPEIKKKWVEALRSGKYKQGKKVLRSGNEKFCCLGVLCDLLVPRSEWTVESTGWDDERFYYRIDGIGGGLSERIMNMAGITVYNEYGHIGKLIKANDVDNKSFNEIADYIETNL